MSADLLIETRDSPGGMRLGMATLNRPQTLNGLTLAMCSQLDAQLRQWEADDSIAIVILRATGEKAFCAGGDLQRLYASVRENASRNGRLAGSAWANDYAREFFAVEYRLDHYIHHYPKPLLCWASGIVMGGGVGLMMGASHRVVTELTRYAMPEISIGVFPDVGASWMLSHLMPGIGVFLALTGARLGGADCLEYGLADYGLDSASWPSLLDKLQNTAWSCDRTKNDVLLHRQLRAMETAPMCMPGAVLRPHHERISRHCGGPDFEAICQTLAQWQQDADPWLARSAQAFAQGSPGSARLGFELQKKARHYCLAQTLRMEYTAMLHCVAAADFEEGVRALLIDKDQNPRWQPATLAQADQAWAASFFLPAWPNGEPSPLANLGK